MGRHSRPLTAASQHTTCIHTTTGSTQNLAICITATGTTNLSGPCVMDSVDDLSGLMNYTDKVITWITGTATWTIGAIWITGATTTWTIWIIGATWTTVNATNHPILAQGTHINHPVEKM